MNVEIKELQQEEEDLSGGIFDDGFGLFMKALRGEPVWVDAWKEWEAENRSPDNYIDLEKARQEIGQEEDDDWGDDDPGFYHPLLHGPHHPVTTDPEPQKHSRFWEAIKRAFSVGGDS